MPTEPRQQLRLAALVLAAVVAVLGLIYVLFFRVTMVPAYQNIRQTDASAIVAELDKAGIPYRLANDGHDVLVPEDRAAEARVAVAGSNVAMGGTVGFELFNDSDMGLTEFAQKINFQRAMQGELARTIMMSQGVEFARVHLALPERSIFRVGQGSPTAAVTIQMTKGHALTPQRVEGIRQLVASSVPALSQSAVAVLDDNGDLVTPATAPDNAFGAPLDERSALDGYYQAKAREAVALAAPDLKYDLVVNTRREVTSPATGAPVGEDRALPDRKDVVLAVLVRTETPLASDVQGKVEAAVTDSLHLQSSAGDSLRFMTGVVAAVAPVPAAMPAPRTAAPVASTDAPAIGGWQDSVPNWWLWLGLAFAALIAWLLLRPRRRLGDAETQSFAERLRASAFERELADAR